MRPDALIDALKSLAQDNLGAEEALAEYKDEVTTALYSCPCTDCSGDPECKDCIEARRILELL